MRRLDRAPRIVDQPSERAICRIVDSEPLVRRRLGKDEGAPAVGKPAGARLHRGTEIEDLAVFVARDIDEPNLRARRIAVAPRVEDLGAGGVEQRTETVRLRRPCQRDSREADEILADDPARLDGGARRGIEIGGEDEIAPAGIELAAAREEGRRRLGQRRHRARSRRRLAQRQAEELDMLVTATVLGNDERGRIGRPGDEVGVVRRRRQAPWFLVGRRAAASGRRNIDVGGRRLAIPAPGNMPPIRRQHRSAHGGKGEEGVYGGGERHWISAAPAPSPLAGEALRQALRRDPRGGEGEGAAAMTALLRHTPHLPIAAQWVPSSPARGEVM